MSVELQSGANMSLTAANPLLTDLLIGFGWEIVQSNSPDPELVASAVLCNRAGRALNDESVVFFNQLSAAEGAARYVTGSDVEQIEVDLAQVPETVEKIVFVVYVDPDIRKPGNFASVRNAYIRVADREENDIVVYRLDRADMTVNAMIFGELYRYNGQWKFRALGDGYTTGITGVASDFGYSL